jgi:hypothetical protein
MLNPAVVVIEVLLNLYVLFINLDGIPAVWKRVFPILVGMLPGIAVGASVLASLQPGWVKIIGRTSPFIMSRGTSPVPPSSRWPAQAAMRSRFIRSPATPGDVQAILTAHYLPRDAEVASNAIAKLNRYKARGDQKEDENLPTVLPTALKTTKLKQEKA